MNLIIKQALVCLEKANYAGYFEEMDKISIPEHLKNNYAIHKAKYSKGKDEWDFDQHLKTFATTVDKFLSEEYKQKSNILNYIDENRILEFIEADLNTVFEILNEVFEDSNDKYNQLYKRSEKQDFNTSTYRNNLEQFIKGNKKDITVHFESLKEDEIQEAKDFTNKSDKEYELLRKLNFNVPLKHFRDLSNTKKSLLPFIIRGEGNYGQKWLYNKLVYDYFERFEPFVKPSLIDFNERNITTFENLLDALCDELNIEGYKDKPLRKKKTMVKNQLLDKMDTTSQILIFKGACASLAEDFEEFYEILLFISDEIEDSKYVDTKCIVLLIENEEHKLSDHQDKFIFLSKTPSYKAKTIKEFV